MDQDPKFKAGYDRAKQDYIKWSNEAYRSGYGQAKADILTFITEAMNNCQDAIRDSVVAPDDKTLMELYLRRAELTRLRALVKGAMKPGF
jgi:hypothetical protein